MSDRQQLYTDPLCLKDQEKPLEAEPEAGSYYADPKPGELVIIRWDPTTTKRARYVRASGLTNALVEVQRVDRKGNPIPDLYGAPRAIHRADVLAPAGEA